MIYEMRTYVAAPGKMAALQKRFREHTVALFEKHGITNVAYFTNAIGGRSDELIYILGFNDANHRDSAWAAFASDPEWRAVYTESEKDGSLVADNNLGGGTEIDITAGEKQRTFGSDMREPQIDVSICIAAGI